MAQLRLAVTLNQLGRNGPALQAADKAVALNQDNGDAFGIRAKIKSESGDLKGALEDYDRASSIVEDLIKDSDEYRSSWVCQCGEKIEGQFTACWSCGTARG